MLHLWLAGAELEGAEHVGPAGETAARQAAGENFGQRRQVGPYVVKALCAARMDAEAGNHFVEDEQAIVLGGEVAERLEEVAAHGHTAEMAAGRLDDHTADALVLRQSAV